MPIIALIVLTLLFWGIYWFVRSGGIDHLQAKSARRKEEARLTKARDSEWIAPLQAVDDPRDAAIVLMFLAARANGDPTREQIVAIEKIAATSLGLEHDLTGRMAQARFIAGRANSFEQAAGLFSNLLMKRLTADERCQLLGMVEEITRVDGPSEAQAEAIAVLKRRTGFAAAR